MQWYDVIFQTINMRSFSSIWYWIALVAVWMSIGHWVLGVPLDMVMRVRRNPDDAAAAEDLLQMTRINAARQVAAIRSGGVLMVGVACFLLSLGAALAIAGLELAQAAMFLAVPLTLVFLARLRLALRLERAMPDAPSLANALIWHRMLVQVIAMVSIFATAIWGMFHNLGLTVLN